MKSYLMTLSVLVLSAASIPVYAQTAEEPAAAAAEPAAEAPAPAAPAPAAPAPAAPVVSAPVVSAPSAGISNEPVLTKALREGIPLRVRQEQPFDTNANNRLEPDEVRAFLRSVEQESSRGAVKNTSDLLYQFDRNKDGYIDRGEAGSFPI